MKYWVFYKIRDANLCKIKPVVYAFAFNKEDRDLFKEFRNMDMFKCEKHEDIKNIRSEFPVNFSYAEYTLTLVRFSTINEFGIKTYVDLQATFIEEEKVMLYYGNLYNNIINTKIPPYSIFTKKIISDLKKLNYDDAYKFSICSKLNRDEDYGIHNDRNIIVDEFSIFMKLFGDTIKNI